MSVGTGKARAEPKHRIPWRHRHHGSKKWKLALGGLACGYLALSGYALSTVDLSVASGTNGHTAANAASTARPSDRTGTGSPSSATTPAPDTTVSGPATRARVAPHPMPVLTIVAFGPYGTSDGDNPGIVLRILDGSNQPWYSLWYTTPEFGNLRAGTGLLVDMGKKVTVRDVRLLLGSEPGAAIQVRIGNRPAADLPTVGTAAAAPGGAVRLETGSARGRYVLIWFTRLPPDGQGHYQVSVYDVTVDGTSR